MGLRRAYPEAVHQNLNLKFDLAYPSMSKQKVGTVWHTFIPLYSVNYQGNHRLSSELICGSMQGKMQVYPVAYKDI